MMEELIPLMIYYGSLVAVPTAHIFFGGTQKLLLARVLLRYIMLFI
jgi:hypothetical protein